MWDLKHLEDSNMHLSCAEFFKNPSRFNNAAKVETGYNNFMGFFFPPPGAIFVGATVSWLMADCRQTETEVSESLRIRYPFPHYLILCQEASEGLGRGEGGGGWEGRQPGVF